MRKGVILAGGTGTRLHPLTLATSKQLLPIYDKPMIYYPLSCLMLAGIREVLIITTPHELDQFKRLFDQGTNWGMSFHYAVQPEPKGLTQAFLIGESFIGSDPVALILGDNLFYGQGFASILRAAAKQTHGAMIFGYQVSDPERYGIVEVTSDGRVQSIEEKPKRPKSRYAIPGLYFLDSRVVQFAKSVDFSHRGELEITDVLQCYLDRDELNVTLLSRGFAWMDAGTHQSLAEAANLVMAVEKRQGLKIGCPEEIAYQNGWMSFESLQKAAATMRGEYGSYLASLLDPSKLTDQTTTEP